jgi:hypothetical protein
LEKEKVVRQKLATRALQVVEPQEAGALKAVKVRLTLVVRQKVDAQGRGHPRAELVKEREKEAELARLAVAPQAVQDAQGLLAAKRKEDGAERRKLAVNCPKGWSSCRMRRSKRSLKNCPSHHN